MSNEEIEALRDEALFEWTEGNSSNYKEFKSSDISNYQVVKEQYQTRLDNWKGNIRGRKLQQYMMDMELDMFEGKVSSDDNYKYKQVVSGILEYYYYIDNENDIRKKLKQIESQLLELRSENIYNGKLLNSIDAREKISELQKEKKDLELEIEKVLGNQESSLHGIPFKLETFLGENPKYSKFYVDKRDDKLISDTRSNLDEIINLIEGDIINLDKKQEYSENKNRYKEIKEEMEKIEFSLSHEANQLNKGQMFSLKQRYKSLCKEELKLRSVTPIDFISEEKENTSTIKKEEQQESNTSGVKKEEKSYTRLVAAQNESNRRLKIKNISNTLSSENLKKKVMAIISGICFSGLMAAVHFSGINPNEAIATEIQALNSFDALKEYVGTFTPAIWGAMIASAASISNYIKHKKNYDKANKEFYDMMDNRPEDYQDIVESQAKSR